MLADEPTGNLDTTRSHEMMEVLQAPVRIAITIMCPLGCDSKPAIGVPNLGNDPGIVSAIGQDESYVGVHELVEFEDRLPRRNVVPLGPDRTAAGTYIGLGCHQALTTCLCFTGRFDH